MGELIDWNNIVSLGAGAPLSDFGDPQREFAAARTRAVVTPVRRFDLLRIHKGEAKAFLQGQLTCDLEQVTAEQAQFGGYCTPKGRLLANFILMSASQGYLMYLPADLANATADRLRKFILRSQVKIEREYGLGILGLGGPGALDLLQREVAEVPVARLAMACNDGERVVRLPGEQFLIVAASADMPTLWAKLTKHATPVGANCWSWLQIQARVPWITAATLDQFLPQMIGLDAVGGVSFDKGCYTGQEIVARSRYLGEVKRSLRPGHTRVGVRPGEALSWNGKQCATVLNAASMPDGGSEFLAVVSEQVDGQATVQTSNGEAASLSALPGASVPG